MNAACMCTLGGNGHLATCPHFKPPPMGGLHQRIAAEVIQVSLADDQKSATVTVRMSVEGARAMTKNHLDQTIRRDALVERFRKAALRRARIGADASSPQNTDRYQTALVKEAKALHAIGNYLLDTEEPRTARATMWARARAVYNDLGMSVPRARNILRGAP